MDGLFIFFKILNHVGARHCRKPLSWRKGLIISTTVGLTKFMAPVQIMLKYFSNTVGFTKTRAFDYKSCQNISSTVAFTKTRAFDYKSCQNISSTVGFTKTRAFCQQILSKYF